MGYKVTWERWPTVGPLPESWKLIHSGVEGVSLLYDLTEDPGEKWDLAETYFAGLICQVVE